jgi:predicted negative regulator of RcsB-dependent stress response
MISDIRELNDDELEVLAGGMDCKWAAIVANIYRASGDILIAAGNVPGAFDAYGHSSGVFEGGCR